MPTGYVQEKFESAPGNEVNTPTLSAKVMYPVLIDYTPDPGTAPMDRNAELRGINEPLAIIPESYDPQWSLTAPMYPDHIGWRLKHILGAPTTTAGDGVITDPDGGLVPTGAYRHVFVSTAAGWGGTGVSPQTTQQIAAYKDQSTFVKLKGCACDTLAVTTPEQGGAQIAASGPALFLDDSISDPSATASYESPVTHPFMRGNLSLPTWLSGTGTSHEDASFTISNPSAPVHSLGSGSKWPDIMEKGDGLLTITGSFSQRQLDPDDLAALRASTGFAIKAKWLNDTIAAVAYKHTLWLEGINAQYDSGGPAALANVRRIGAQFGFRLTTAGSGASATITLVNATSSYA